jgi:D-glycero-D-manno-heptose 1,7-bisphosphate phosphatase
MKTKAVFLDRDGVINEYPGDFLYVTRWEQFCFLPGVAGALQKLQAAGFIMFVVSNQAGVGKGLYPKAELDLITRNMLESLAAQGVQLREVYYCTHSPEENCLCRKPKTGMVEQAIDQLSREGIEIDRAESFFIGDTMRDIETGKSSGLKTILVLSGKEKSDNRQLWTHTPDFVAADLSEAADYIVRK